jgi:hypothetical protein
MRAKHDSGGSHTFADTLLGADLGAILHGMDGEIDLGEWLLLLYSVDGIVDLVSANLLGLAGR